MSQSLSDIKYYFKVAGFRAFSYFAIIFPAYRKFRSKLLHKSFEKPVAIFFFGRFGQGGAENYTNSIINVISARYHCLIVAESKSANHVSGVFELLSLEDFTHAKIIQPLLVRHLLSKFTPEICANVTSASFFRAYIANRHNLLANVGKLFFFFFSKKLFLGLDQNVIKHIYLNATWAVSDNQRALSDINETYGKLINPEKNICLYNKVKFDYNDTLFESNLSAAIKNIQEKERVKLLWASRLDNDKNLQLLLNFSVKYPNIDIDVYGESLFNNSEPLIVQLFKLPNVSYCGKFNSIQQILSAKFEYAAFMFTSYWEGLPNILLEVGLLGLPILAPNVGGVNELISDETGYLVENSIQSYYSGLTNLVNNMQATRNKSLALRDLILFRHSTEVYRKNVELIFCS